MQFFKQYWYVILIVILIVGGMIFKNEDNPQETSVILESNDENSPLKLEEEKVDTNVFVDIKGEIKMPGVYTLKVGDRVENAIEIAGGLTENADSNQINMAERVYDEMVIYIPSTQEDVGISEGNQTGNDKIKINLATADELTSLPGIGQSKANAIIEYREQYGKFKTVEDLTNVSGIGEKTAERLAEFIIVP